GNPSRPTGLVWHQGAALSAAAAAPGFCRSKTRILSAADTTRLPSGEMAADQTGPSWSSKRCSTLPARSQTRTLLSVPAETICLPSLENARQLTRPAWPANVLTGCPVVTFQSRIVQSTTTSFPFTSLVRPHPETAHLPSREMATALTGPLCGG